MSGYNQEVNNALDSRTRMLTSKLSEANLRRCEDFPFDIRETRIEKVLRILRELHPQRLLDVACGDGYIVAALTSRPDLVVGCDLSLHNLQKASRRGVMLGVVTDLNGNLPFVSGSFDCIFAGEIIEHLIDTDGLVQECARVLKRGGYLLLTTPNLASLENRLRLLFGLYPKWLDYHLRGSHGHVRAYTPRILKKQLEEYGFKVLRHIGNFVPFIPQAFLDDRRFRWLEYTGNLFPNLSQDIIMLAQKVSAS